MTDVIHDAISAMIEEALEDHRHINKKQHQTHQRRIERLEDMERARSTRVSPNAPTSAAPSVGITDESVEAAIELLDTVCDTAIGLLEARASHLLSRLDAALQLPDHSFAQVERYECPSHSLILHWEATDESFTVHWSVQFTAGGCIRNISDEKGIPIASNRARRMKHARMRWREILSDLRSFSWRTNSLGRIGFKNLATSTTGDET